MIEAAFAVPGDLETVTGGYLYEKRLLHGLRDAGTPTELIRLGGSFPDPTPDDHAQAAAALAAVPPDRPLIVDGFVFGSLSPGAFAAITAPAVGMVHHPLALEEGLTAERRRYLFETERANLRRADAVLVPSPHTRRMLVSEYGADPERITVARPGTDRPTGVRAPSDPPLVLSVGIQHPRKGHDVLLRALARVTDAPWRAVIVGSAWDPAHAAELARLRGELGLEGRVRLAGAVSDAERDALAREAAVFALATRYEGYGLVFDEALARGLPIVSCRTGAVPDTVPADAGLLVPPEDPAAFADALRILLADPARRADMSAATARAGRALPSWHDTALTAQRLLASLTHP